MTRQILRLALTLFAVLVFRVTLGPRLAVAGVSPDMAAAFVFYLTLARKGTFGIVAGFVTGLLIDADHPEALGVTSLAFCTLALLTSWASESVDASDPIVGGALLFLVALAAETIRALALSGLDPGRFILLWLRWGLPGAAYTGIAGPIVVSLFHAMFAERRWLGGRA